MTSGLRVYRYRGWYHVYYIHCNSGPDGLGLWTIAEIPKESAAYDIWLTNLRAKLERNFEKLNDASSVPRSMYGNPSFQYHITRIQPTKTTRIHWIWEIDCDNEILHVNSRPFFCLSYVPRNADFLSSITLDHYGHRACSESKSREYKWKRNATHPNVPSRSKVAIDSKTILLASRTMLGLPERLGKCEIVRNSLYRTLLGTALRTWTLAHEIPLLHVHSTIPEHMWNIALVLLELALRPMILEGVCTPLRRNPPSGSNIRWLRDDVCFRVFKPVEEETNCEDAVMSLINDIHIHSLHLPTTYGILFSFTHIIIVQVQLHGVESTVTQTPPLPFLPSFFATSPSTSGISALMDLSYALESDSVDGRPVACHSYKLMTVPTEIWYRIGMYLTNTSDLKQMGTLTVQSRLAVNDLFKYPHIAGYRIIQPRSDPVDIFWVSPRWCRAYQNDYHPQDGVSSLYSQRFDCDHHSDVGDLVVDIAPGDTPLHIPQKLWWPASNSKEPGLLREGQIDIIPANPSVIGSGWAIKYRIIQRRCL